MPIQTQTNVLEFFREMVGDAIRNLEIEASQESEFYLVNLLAEFSARTPETDEPLALQFKRALAAEFEEQVRLLKALGDSSLYLSGFFADSLNRGLVDVDYYIAMGGQAYEKLSNLVTARPNGALFRDLYEELACKFPRFVDVLSEVSEQSSLGLANSNRGLVELYERWRKTGSQRLAAKLRERGVLPSRGNGGGYTH